jgi:Sulfotransferase domain
MKLIGAGLPRTATTTQMIALETLGLPCYHMRDMMGDLATSVPQFRKAFEGNADWDEIFEGKESEVDWPASYHWRELIEVYPDAKVLLSVRDADKWVRSMQNTINQIAFGKGVMYHLVWAQYDIDPVYAAWIDLMLDMMWEERGAMAGTNGEPAAMAEAMERWNQDVIDTVPADRLLVWRPEEGWEPLCEFLDVPVPDMPFPNVNDTENFQKNLIMGPAIQAINAWWEENKPQERQPGHLDGQDAAAKRPAGPAAQATA